MTRRRNMPEREWTVVQCEDGKEYLIPFGMEGDTELNCPSIPLRELLAVWFDNPRKENTCVSTTAPRKRSPARRSHKA